MILEASVTGVFKTFLLILGVFVALRFIGRLMIAKRNLEEENRLKKERDKFDRELKQKKINLGKTSILNSRSNSSIEDVDFEEVV